MLHLRGSFSLWMRVEKEQAAQVSTKIEQVSVSSVACPPSRARTPCASGSGIPVDVVNRRTVSISGWIIGFFAAIGVLGFSVASPLCTFIYLRITAKEKWMISILFGIAAWVFVYGIFDRILHVPFPAGQLFDWLRLSP